MQVSEVAELAVEYVRNIKGVSLPNKDLLKDKKYSELKADPQFSALVMHAAVTLQLDQEQIDSVIKELGKDSTWASTFLPLQNLKEASGVLAYRKQYQRIMTDQTRCLTYDLFGECAEGFVQLIGLYFEKLGGSTMEDYDFNKIWDLSLEIIGRYNLEPFKVLSIWINSFPHKYSKSFASWLSSSMWNQHSDWVAILKLVNLNNRIKLLGYLVVYKVVPLEIVWGIFGDNPTSKFNTFEENWKNEHGGVVKKDNALAMAMPLADDDDDDDDENEDYEEGINMDFDMDVDLECNNGSGANELNIQNSDPDNMESVEFVRDLVGEILCALAYVDNKEIEEVVLQLISTYPIVFSTSKHVSIGISRLVAHRLDEGVDDICSLDDLLIPMCHSIHEPAWHKLNEFVGKLDLSVRIDNFRKYLLPSIDLHPKDESLLFSFDTSTRHMLYTDLVNRIAKENLIVKSRFLDSEKATKDLLKRLTKKDAKPLIVPQLLKEFSACAWPSLNIFIQQVESYNIGKLVAIATSSNDGNSSFSILAMDMLPLVLMQQFTTGRQVVQDDGLHESKWLRLLAQFAGDIAVCHPQFDFIVLIKMCLHQFASNDFSQIFVLDQIVRRLCGIPHQTNLSIQQLLALNTGDSVAELFQKIISEQPYPQKERFLDTMRQHKDPSGDLLSLTIAALNYAYSELAVENSSKVLASRLDALTNLLVIFQSFNVTAEKDLSTNLKLGAKFAPQFSLKPKEGSIVDFDTLQLYDVAVEPEIYKMVQSKLDSKDVDRILLNHRLRIKSVKQKLGDDFPDLNTIVHRILLSPTDALFTSRYLQMRLKADHLGSILSRGVVLSVLKAATPLETESFAVFFTDIMTFVYTSEDNNSGISSEQIRELNRTLTSSLIEAATPNATYTVLNNVFLLLQRTLSVFPLFEEDGKAIERRIMLLITVCTGDLETAVRSLSPQIAKRSHLWCSTDASSDFKDDIVQNNSRLMRRLAASIDQR